MTTVITGSVPGCVPDGYTIWYTTELVCAPFPEAGAGWAFSVTTPVTGTRYTGAVDALDSDFIVVLIIARIV